MEEYIKLLDLPDEFDLEDLKHAYREHVKKYHPDKASNEAERVGFEALMKKLNEANAELKEYLENHGGKYTKASYNDSFNSADNTSYNDNSSEETQEEYQEESQEETIDEDVEEMEDEISKLKEKFADLNVSEAIIEMIALMLNPKALYKLLKETKILSYLIGGCIIALIFYGIDSHLIKTNNAVQQNETKQEQVAEPQATTTSDTDSTSQEENAIEENFDNNPEMQAYLQNLHRKVKTNWVIPTDIRRLQLDHFKTVAVFKVSREGYLTGEPRIKETSGYVSADKAAIDAIKDSAPFPPFPSIIKKEIIDVELNFEANKKPNNH